MVKIIAKFEHKGVNYDYEIWPIGMEAIPYAFQVYETRDKRYWFMGQLIFYGFTNEWRFDNNPAIADELANIVMLYYQ